MDLASLLRQSVERTSRAAEEPLGLVRLAAGALLLFGTVVALMLALSGVSTRALYLVGAFWAVYGLVRGILRNLVEPGIEGAARAFADVGLEAAADGLSGLQALAARGEYQAAADGYLERARDPAVRVEATLRRAALLAGPLGAAEAAAMELEALRATPLPDADDLRVGLALAELYERRLADPGRAMAELRRIIDRHPDARQVPRLRRVLADLKAAHFGGEPPR